MPTLESYGTNPLADQQLHEVRTLLRTDPRLWRTHGNVSAWSREKTLADIPRRTVKYECVKAGIQHMRNNFLMDGASEVERMMVEQIITHWLHVGTTCDRLESLAATNENQAELARLETRYNQDQIRLNRAITLLNRTRKVLIDLEIKRRSYRTNDKRYSWETPFEPEFEEESTVETSNQPEKVPKQTLAAVVTDPPIESESKVIPEVKIEKSTPTREPREKPPVPVIPARVPRPDGGFYPDFPGVARGSQSEVWYQTAYDEQMRKRNQPRMNESEI